MTSPTRKEEDIQTLSLILRVTVSFALIAAGASVFFAADGATARLLASTLMACGVGLIAIGPFVEIVSPRALRQPARRGKAVLPTRSRVAR